MRIDIALTSAKLRVVQADIMLDEAGEIKVAVSVGTKIVPVRLVLVKRFLVVTAEPALDSRLTARWTGEVPHSTNWQTLSRRWDLSQQGWVCEVRQHLP